MTSNAEQALELRSTVHQNGQLEIRLEHKAIPVPGDDEVIIRVEAAPINPSDLFALLAFADVSTGETRGSGSQSVYTASIPANVLPTLKARMNKNVRAGNEGAGTVVSAGASKASQALLGKTVAAMDGGMYCQYRKVHVSQCLVLNEGTTARQGAACFVNPLTALGILETAKLDGHEALIHTAAASNLGKMLNRLCIQDQFPLLNIVRREEHVSLLEKLGARHVLNSSGENFREELTDAIADSEAYVAFDAVGGGKLVSQILSCMENAAARKYPVTVPYGTDVFKQVYIYGSLDPSPTLLKRNFGFTWGVQGWLLTPFMKRVGTERMQELRQRVVDEIDTTFASEYTREVSLEQLLQAEEIAAISKQATGEKYLITPAN